MAPREQAAGTTERQKGTLGRREGRAVAGYRLGLFDPDPASTAVEFVGRVFLPTRSDRHTLARIISRYNQKVAGDPSDRLCLAAFPVEA